MIKKLEKVRMKKYNVYGIMAAALVCVCALVGCAKDSGASGTDVITTFEHRTPSFIKL